MKTSGREKFTFERVQQHFINDDNITYRNLRSDQKQAENHFWELTGQSLNQFLQNENKDSQLFAIFFEKTFLHMFVDIKKSIKRYSIYFDTMYRSEWEAINKDDQLILFFLELQAEVIESLENIINKIKAAYKNGTARESLTGSVLLPIDTYDQHNKRIKQPISKTFTSKYFSNFIENKNDVPHIKIYTSFDRKLVRMLHSEMKKAIMYTLCILTFNNVFVPFTENKHLPYFKIKDSSFFQEM